MKRRELLRLGTLAFGGAVMGPIALKTQRQYHFIAIGDWGGQILDGMYERNVIGKYTYIRDADCSQCEVPDLRLIELQHPYTGDYLLRNRIKKMPETVFEALPFNTEFIHQDDHVVLLSFPVCYVSRYITPLLAQHLSSHGNSFHILSAKPFHFYPQVYLKAADDALAELGVHAGKLTTIIADSIRKAHPNGKMNLKEAFELLHERFCLEVNLMFASHESV